MAENPASGSGTAGSLRSLQAERADFANTMECMRQMARDFDTMTEMEKSFEATRVATLLQARGPSLRRCVWKGQFTPEAFQWHKQCMDAQKARAQQLFRDFVNFADALTRRAEDLERREQEQQRQSQPVSRVTAEERAAETRNSLAIRKPLGNC